MSKTNRMAKRNVYSRCTNGCVFTNFELYEEFLSIVIAKKQLPYVFIALKVSPVGGAVIGALQRIEYTLAYIFLQQFSQELKTH